MILTPEEKIEINKRMYYIQGEITKYDSDMVWLYNEFYKLVDLIEDISKK